MRRRVRRNIAMSDLNCRGNGGSFERDCRQERKRERESESAAVTFVINVVSQSGRAGSPEPCGLKRQEWNPEDAAAAVCSVSRRAEMEARVALTLPPCPPSSGRSKPS